MNQETRAIHGGFNQDPNTGATTLPIYLSAGFAKKTAEELADTFEGKQFGHIYSRISNPTTAEYERRLAHIENALGALATSTGLAAISGLIMAICESGDEIITSHCLFGGTIDLFEETLEKFGLKFIYVDPTNADEIASKVTDKTALIFLEAITNPKLDIPDFAKVSEIAKKANLPFVLDNTLAPLIIDAKALGIDILVGSSTKYIASGTGALGGYIIDTGNHNWKNAKSKEIAETANQVGNFALLARARRHALHNIGSTPSPFNAYLANFGLETLVLRVKKHNENAIKLAKHLNDHPKVTLVNHPSLDAHPDHSTAKQYFKNGYGGLMTFSLKTKEDAFKVIDALKLAKNMANLGDTKTLVIHPESTIFATQKQHKRESAGVTPEMIRLSVGIEHIDDIIADFDQALEAL